MTEQIGRFQVRKRLGGGGFGEVFLATDTIMGREVAIKLFRPKDENLVAFATPTAAEGLASLRARFVSEARILAQLGRVPQVVDVLEFGELPDGTPYYVMPYLAHSLADELGKDVYDRHGQADLPSQEQPRALPLQAALGVVEQTLQGLAAAHGHGLVHRDIKPANLMADGEGRWQIVDFGIAKAPDGQHSTMSHVGLGSRNYMAPEQRESAKHVDASADVYATGVVAYRALTGKLPIGRFPDPNVLVPALGQSMNDLLLQMLAQDKADRPKDAAAALALFQQARAAVGQQDNSAQSGTWAGDKGASGLRDELKPLKARIEARVSEVGFIAEREMQTLEVMADVAALSKVDLQTFIDATINADRTLQGRHRLGRHLAEQVRQRGGPLDDQALSVYIEQGRLVRWNEAQLSRVMQAAVQELRAHAQPAASGHGTTPARSLSAPVAAKPAAPSPAPAAAAAAGVASTGTGAQAQPATSGTGWGMPLLGFLLLLGVGSGLYEWRQGQIAAEQRERERTCEQLVAPTESKFLGMYLSKVDGANAVRACAPAAKASANPRLWFLYGRALQANKDDAEAVRWYRKAAEAGNADGMVMLGFSYFGAVGVPKDEAEAVRWLRRAAEAGNADVMMLLAAGYRSDKSLNFFDFGLPSDDVEAVRWDRRAAEAGNSQAMSNLGFAYENGIGVAKDEAEAMRWYQRAVAAGSEDAREAMDELATKRAEQARLAEQLQRDLTVNAGFEDLGDGRLRDTQTGLVWTQSDNGRDINWNDANAYCQGKGMRLPSIEELAAIYNRPGAGTTACGDVACAVSPLFRLTSWWFWSGTRESSSRAFANTLFLGHRTTLALGSAKRNRALCVGRS